MNKQLEICNLGPIHNNICVDLSKRINIIIGKQSVGKSTIVKAAYFCKNAPSRVLNVLYNVKDRAEVMSEESFMQSYIHMLKKQFDSVFGAIQLQHDSYIKYYYSDKNYIIVNYDEEKGVCIAFSEDIENSLRNLYEEFVHDLNVLRKITNPNVNVLINNACDKVWIKFIEELTEPGTIYIPASRAMTSLFLAVYSEQITRSFDGTYLQYLNLAAASRRNSLEKDELERLKDESSNNLLNADQYIFMQELYENILQAKYIFKDNQDLLITEDNKKISVRNGSSGQQEILWLLNIIKDFVIKGIRVCFAIEEPETNLFPSTQFETLKYIVAAANIGNNEVIITTHSPYMLSSANMMLYAGDNKIYAQSVVEEQCMIDPEDFNCFYLDEHSCETIYENGEIDANVIDSISDKIFDKINTIMNKKLAEEGHKDAM